MRFCAWLLFAAGCLVCSGFSAPCGPSKLPWGCSCITRQSLGNKMTYLINKHHKIAKREGMKIRGLQNMRNHLRKRINRKLLRHLSLRNRYWRRKVILNRRAIRRFQFRLRACSWNRRRMLMYAGRVKASSKWLKRHKRTATRLQKIIRFRRLRVVKILGHRLPTRICSRIIRRRKLLLNRSRRRLLILRRIMKNLKRRLINSRHWVVFYVKRTSRSCRKLNHRILIKLRRKLRSNLLKLSKIKKQRYALSRLYAPIFLNLIRLRKRITLHNLVRRRSFKIAKMAYCRRCRLTKHKSIACRMRCKKGLKRSRLARRILLFHRLYARYRICLRINIGRYRRRCFGLLMAIRIMLKRKKLAKRISLLSRLRYIKQKKLVISCRRRRGHKSKACRRRMRKLRKISRLLYLIKYLRPNRGRRYGRRYGRKHGRRRHGGKSKRGHRRRNGNKNRHGNRP